MSPAHKGIVALAASAALLLEGCAWLPGTTTTYIDSSGLPTVAEVPAVPFFPDDSRHCGPAALATILVHSGVPVTPEALAPMVQIPARGGALQAEIKAAARGHGRLAYELPSRLDAALRETRSGRPVLVLQKLDPDDEQSWHYAVLVGYNAARETVLLRSGTERRLAVDTRAFDYSWRPSGRWAMITLAPGELPADAEQARYLRAAADFDRRGTPAERQAAWRAALQLWPASLTALIGLGSAHYAGDELSDAARVLDQAVAAHPDSADAHNNLAHVLGRLGERERALWHARTAVRLGGRSADVYRHTLDEIERP